MRFTWSTDCEKAFQELMGFLTRYPVLAFPITNKEFIVQVAVSKTAVDGVLQQEQHDGTVRPVSYCSYALSPLEQNWKLYSQEACAPVLAVRKRHMEKIGSWSSRSTTMRLSTFLA